MQIASVLTHIMRGFDAVGARAPKPVAAEYAQLVELTERVQQLKPEGTFAGAVLEALANGEDPTTSPAVQAAAVAATIRDNRGGLDNGLRDRAQAFVDKHAPALIGTLHQPFAEAAEVLTEAVEHLDGADLDDPQAVVSLGGDAAEWWVKARRANATAVKCEETWRLLAGAATGVPAVDLSHRLLLIADVDPDRYIDERLRGSKLAPWQAANAGHRLDLADVDGFQERIQRVAEALAAAQRRADTPPRRPSLIPTRAARVSVGDTRGA